MSPFTKVPGPRARGRRSGLWIKLLVLGTTLFLVLGMSEGLVRWVFRDVTTTADNRSYFARRWRHEHVRLNALGFRERELQIVKSKAVYRIAVIGDSFTFGQGIPEEARFSNLLEKRLNEQEDRYEVLNFGKSGAETVNELATLRRILPKAGPDFVLLQWYVNDFEGTNKKDRPTSWPLVPFSGLRLRLQRSSSLYYLLNQQWNVLQEAAGITGSYAAYMRRRFENPQSAESIEYLHTLDAFLDVCRKRGIPMGIVLFPDLTEEPQGYPFDYLHERVLENCAREGIPCVDLSSTFAPYMRGRVLWVNRFDNHPGPLANRLAAERLMETFGPIWRSGRTS